MANQSQPALGPQHLKAISVAPSHNPKNNLAITFHFAPAALGAHALPKQISVGLHGHSYDAAQTAVPGDYLLLANTDPKAVPAESITSPVTLPANFNSAAPDIGGPVVTLPSIILVPVPCPPNCKSVLFGSACVVCLEARIVWVTVAI